MDQTKSEWQGLKDLLSKDNHMVLLGFFMAFLGVLKQSVTTLLIAIFLVLVSIDNRIWRLEK